MIVEMLMDEEEKAAYSAFLRGEPGPDGSRTIPPIVLQAMARSFATVLPPGPTTDAMSAEEKIQAGLHVMRNAPVH